LTRKKQLRKIQALYQGKTMKKNLRRIPQDIYAKLKTIKGNEIMVGCAVKFKADALLSGSLKHLGISLTPQGVQFPPAIIPPKEQGKYSAYNIEGIEIIRKDLPKETHYIWTDINKGT
jgi:hypothetical protein